MNSKKYVPVLILIFVLLLVAIVFVPSYLIKRDYDSYCESYKRFLTRASTMEEAINAVTFAEEVYSQTLMPSANRAFKAIATADTKQKYELVRVAARESGYSDWECPQMKDHLSSLNDETPE